MFILKFLLFIFLCLFVVGILIIFFFINSVRRMKQQFNDLSRQHRFETANQETNTVEEHVEDHRDCRQVNRRIIADDEGEYVDFEEDKS
ncbi:MAG: DUF4834 family protein [Prevotellaceae bacterium]|nr:DUF4834 family protein [Prevotellaceae bacterium]